MTTTLRGSCCCGAIRFELLKPPTMMGTCHCARCRKSGASVFVLVRREDFRWICGRDLVSAYEPPPPFHYLRGFCRQCGSALGEPTSSEATFPVAANCLDDDPGVRNRFHEFVADKPAWYEIGDDAPQFPRHPVSAAPSSS